MQYGYFVEQFSFTNNKYSCKFSVYSFFSQTLAEESLRFYLNEATKVPDLFIISSGVFSYEPGKEVEYL